MGSFISSILIARIQKKTLHRGICFEFLQFAWDLPEQFSFVKLLSTVPKAWEKAINCIVPGCGCILAQEQIGYPTR